MLGTGLFLLWVSATICLGGVAAPFERIYPLLASLLTLVVLIIAASHEHRNAPEKPPFLTFLVGLWLGIVLLGVFQCVSLPSSLLRILSPLAHHLTFAQLNILEIRPRPNGYPVSLDTPSTLGALLDLLTFSLVLTASCVLMRLPEVRRRLANWICAFAAAVAFFGLVHRFSGSQKMFWFLERGWTFFGPYVNANHAGALFCASAALGVGLLSLATSKSYRISLVLCVSLLSLGLFFTGSRAAVAALGGTLLVHFAINQPREGVRWARGFYVGFALSVATLTALIWKAPSFARLTSTPEKLIAGTELRIEFWKTAARLWLHSPLAGVGFGAFSRVSSIGAANTSWVHAEHVENDYLEALASGGLIGFACLTALLFFLICSMVGTVRAKKPGSVNPAFALGTSALLLNSMFVFNAPLPAHQILLAVLVGGTLATRRYDLAGIRWFRFALAAICVAGIAAGAYRILPGMPKGRESVAAIAPSSVASLTLTDRYALAHLQIAEAESILESDPIDANALFTLAQAEAWLGHPDRAKIGYTAAVSLAPWLLFPRVESLRAMIPVLPSSESLPLITTMAENPGPLPSSVVARFRLEAALLSFRQGDKSKTSDHLNVAEGLTPGDWHVALFRAILEPKPAEQIEKSWAEAQKRAIDGEDWDRDFFRILPIVSDRIDLSQAVNRIGARRRDVGTFLLRLKEAGFRRTPMTIRLDDNLPSPRLRPNSPITASNTTWITPAGSLETPEILDVQVRRVQTTLDAYLLPVHIELKPSSISFRIQVKSFRPLSRQMIVQAGERLFLTPKEARNLGDGMWEVAFPFVRNSLPVSTHPSPPVITGVGFTPLEKDGRYAIGPIEVFVDPAR
ncbi:MAG TPA: O-antigen ligase family protein [Bdellovibrionota bacterium]|nr:O-antigen ligase family protein [Bdellovibrionota bacterium]